MWAPIRARSRSNPLILAPSSTRESRAVRALGRPDQELATYATGIEDHFETPQDVEWLVDGDLDELFVVQARPETVHGAAEGNVLRTHRLEEPAEPLLEADIDSISVSPDVVVETILTVAEFES